MIKKITEDIFLYLGDVKTKTELQSIVIECQELIAANHVQIDSIKLIEIIPQIQSNPQYLKAMELYNSQKQDEIGLLEATSLDLSIHIDFIKSCL